MTMDASKTLQIAKSRHGTYTGCRGQFTLQPSPGLFDLWECDDCRTIIRVNESETEMVSWVLETTVRIKDVGQHIPPEQTERRHPACGCHQEIGDSPCVVHGEYEINGKQYVICSDRSCSNAFEADTLEASAWVLLESGWLCLQCQPF